MYRAIFSLARSVLPTQLTSPPGSLLGSIMSSPTESSHAHEFELVITGFSFGLLHVLAGPDHLSALAALAVGTSYKAFVLGFRWGLGHSTGLVVIAVIFIWLKGDLDLRRIGRYCDFIVGLFMVTLGSFGIVTAIRTYREKKLKRDHDLSESQNLLDKQLETVESSTSPNTLTRQKSRVSLSVDRPSTSSPRDYYDHDHDHEHFTHQCIEECQGCVFIDLHDPFVQRVLSFSVGLLHGVAGPGAVLGVLPAVEMRKWTSSCLYLGSFIVASTLSMGTFAALYGESTKRLGATAEVIELGLNVFSSMMSVIVGTTWLCLSVLGKLEDFFH